jgi:glycerate kinase
MRIARVVAAPLAFKGTLAPADAADAIAGAVEGLGIACRRLPLADGGTGTMNALMTARGGFIHTLPVPGPSFLIRDAQWGMTVAGDAIIDAAGVVGLADVPPDDRIPSTLTTLGLGLALRSIVRTTPRSIIIGLGDTATHDCGLGVGRAFGYRFLDSLGRELPPMGIYLPDLAAIELRREEPEEGELDEDLDDIGPPDPSIPITIYCDVMNPLTGRDGAALTFAGQKGADAAMIEMLERGGHRFAEIVRRDLGRDVADVPGAGAGGGLGAGLMAFLGARPESGADALLDAVGFREAVTDADLVITGEGRLDAKTLLGKGVGGISEIVAAAGRRLLVIAGSVEGEKEWWEERLCCRIVELGEIVDGESQRERLARAVIEGLGVVGAG